MNKIMYLQVLITILVFAGVSSAVITQDDRVQMQSCRADCKMISNNQTNSCNAQYSSCKQECSTSSCRKVCIQEKTLCTRNVTSEFKTCQSDCTLKSPGKNRCTWKNNSYNLNEKFPDGCNICSCNQNGKVNCVRDNFCNKNATLSQNTCTNAGGLFLQLCTGPYYSIVCSADKFCLCDGTAANTCPSNYTCLHDFTPPIKRKASLPGYRNLIGQKLGDIGVCVKN